MAITTLSSREFSQRTSCARKAALEGPVIIPDRGHPAYESMRYAEFERITGRALSIADPLGQPPCVEIVEVEFPRSPDSAKPADFA